MTRFNACALDMAMHALWPLCSWERMLSIAARGRAWLAEFRGALEQCIGCSQEHVEQHELFSLSLASLCWSLFFVECWSLSSWLVKCMQSYSQQGLQRMYVVLAWF